MTFQLYVNSNIFIFVGFPQLTSVRIYALCVKINAYIPTCEISEISGILKFLSPFQNYEIVSPREIPAALKQNGSPVCMQGDTCIN